MNKKMLLSALAVMVLFGCGKNDNKNNGLPILGDWKLASIRGQNAGHEVTVDMKFTFATDQITETTVCSSEGKSVAASVVGKATITAEKLSSLEEKKDTKPLLLADGTQIDCPAVLSKGNVSYTINGNKLSTKDLDDGTITELTR